jgi:Flp pilus assembly pilin Flp
MAPSHVLADLAAKRSGGDSVQQIRQLRHQAGQTMAEYAVTLGVITVSALAAFTLLSTNVGAAIASTAELVGLAGG